MALFIGLGVGLKLGLGMELLKREASETKSCPLTLACAWLGVAVALHLVACGNRRFFCVFASDWHVIGTLLRLNVWCLLVRPVTLGPIIKHDYICL